MPLELTVFDRWGSLSRLEYIHLENWGELFEKLIDHERELNLWQVL